MSDCFDHTQSDNLFDGVMDADYVPEGDLVASAMAPLDWHDVPALRAGYEAIIAGLDPDQMAEVMQPFDIVASASANAGAGKTHFLCARLFRICFEGPSPRNTVAISFTNKSGKELRDRFNRLFEEHLDPSQIRTLPRPFVGTLHGYGHTLLSNLWGLSRSVLTESRTRRLLRDLPSVQADKPELKPLAVAIEQMVANGETHYLIWPEFDAEGTFVRCHNMLSRSAPGDIRLRPAFPDQIGRLDWFSSSAVQARLSGLVQPAWSTPEWNTLQRSVASRYATMAGVGGAVLAQILVEYATEKYTSNAMDIGDLLVQPVFLMAQHDSLRLKVRRRYAQFLIDEAQDLALLDLSLVVMSFGGPDMLRDMDAMDNRSLIFVSDTKQTLYRWRQAMPEVQDNLDQYLGIPVHFGKLSRNYRSVAPLVSLANSFAQGFDRRHLSPSVAVVPPAPDSIKINHFEDTDQEDVWIAQEMLRLHHEGHPWGAMTFLARTNRDLQQFEATLIARRIPYKIRSDPRRITQSPSYTFVHALFSLALNPRDATALTPFCTALKGVGEKTVERVRRSVLEGLQSDPEATVASALMERVGEKGFPVVCSLFSATVPVIRANLAGVEMPELLGLVRSALLLSCSFPDVRHESAKLALVLEWPPVERVIRLVQAVHAAYLLEDDFHDLTPARRTRDVHAALALSKDAAEAEGTPEDGHKVIVSTTHGYKGLQNRFIFGAHLTRPMPISSADMDDEMCGFFVIITRPQRKLYLTSSSMCRDFRNQMRPGITNPFLSRYRDCLQHLIRSQTCKR